jgi:hypothetical protein
VNCCYPNCKSESTKSWALAPVCDEHHEIIRKEVHSGDIHGRPEYMKIYENTFHAKVKGRRKSY